MAKRVIKVDKSYRDFRITRAAVNEEKRTVELSFSSEAPVERWFGMEVLDHSEKAVDLRRLRRGGALLIDHDPRNQVGVIEEAAIDPEARMGRARVRFGRSAKANEIFQDVVDGIRSNTSVAYEINELKLEETGKETPDTYRATSWTPLEISLVSIPADINVGVGREAEPSKGKELTVEIPDPEKRQDPSCMDGDMSPEAECSQCEKSRDCSNPGKERKTTAKEIRIMDKCTICGADMNGDKCSNANCAQVAEARSKANQKSTEDMEKERIAAITNVCRANSITDNIRDAWITQGYSFKDVSEGVLQVLEERGRTNPQPKTKLGMGSQEVNQYSLRRAIIACDSNDWSQAGLELEASKAISQRMGTMPDRKKFYVPFDVLQRPVDVDQVHEMRQRMGMTGRRDLTAGGSAGYLVQTDNVGFIEILRNRSVIFKMGARRLSGLTGNVAIPKMSVGASATWLASEAATITEQTQTFVQVPLSPKNVGAYTEISRQLLLQSVPGVEGIVSDDLAQAVAIAADAGVISGAGGSGEPDGIIGYSGVGSVTGTSLGYAGILEFQSDVASSNVMPSRGGYITTPVVAALMMQRVKYTSTASPLWEGNIWDGQMAGFPAMSSGQVPTGDMIFGDFSEIVVGEWGVLEIEVNPYAGFTAGIVGVRAIYTMDCGFRRPFAFSIATSIT